MEIIKKLIQNGSVTKIHIGSEFNEDNSEVVGPVELDIESQAHFVEIINTIFDEGNTNVMIDMSNINYIDSSGLWALFEGHKKAIQRGKKLALVNPDKDVKRVLDITKMSSKMDIFDTEEDALKALS
jgi:anti-sigma B factor antagonist